MKVNIINGYEGHTKDKMVLLSEICEFIHRCLNIEDINNDMDDLVEFIEEHAPDLNSRSSDEDSLNKDYEVK